MYVGAVEVATLFLRKDWTDEQWRHAFVEDALNKRLVLTTHSIEFEIRRWDDAPRLRDMARWLDRILDDLRADPAALPVDELGLPVKVYSTRGRRDRLPVPTAAGNLRDGER